MYISGILQYLLWPAFIIAAWFIIKAALSFYENKFPTGDKATGLTGQKSRETNEEIK
jgi:hypothetical protein